MRFGVEPCLSCISLTSLRALDTNRSRCHPLEGHGEPGLPPDRWTAQITSEAKPTLTFANLSGCTFATGNRETTLRSGFVDIKPDSDPNPVNPSSKGVVPVNKRLFVTGAIGSGAAQVLGSDAVCVPSNCGQ